MNKLPVRTYVRQRVSTIVQDVANQSSGSVSLDLNEPSDISLILMADPGGDNPGFFVAAVGRTPTMSDFDIVISPTFGDYIKPGNMTTLHLPAKQCTLQWAAFTASGAPMAFSGMNTSKMVVAVDQ